jgi:MFS family permease
MDRCGVLYARAAFQAADGGAADTIASGSFMTAQQVPEGGRTSVTGTQPAAGPGATSDPRTARRDFRLLWAGQSANLLGDQFMVVALPLLALTVLGASPAQAALLPFALNLPFLIVGLPAGVIVDRFRRRSMMLRCESVQATAFLLIAVLAYARLLPFPLLLALVAVAGCAGVFFQVAYPSFLPELFSDERDLHSGNTRLSLSESLSTTLGPMISGPVIAIAGTVAAILANVGSFLLSMSLLLGIRCRERPRAAVQGGRWPARGIRDGLSFVLRHPQLEPVFTCGSVYVIFLSMVEASLVAYCRDVLHLSVVGIGLVVGMAAAGFPLGNLASGRLIGRLGVPKTLVLGASVSVTGLILMPLAGSAGSVIGLIGGSVIHGIGEGAFSPTSVTLRQTASPPEFLGRVNAVQRFLIWGMIPVGSGLAALFITLLGLRGALWVGGTGTTLCLPALYRRGIRAAFHGAGQIRPPLGESGAGSPG